MKAIFQSSFFRGSLVFLAIVFVSAGTIWLMSSDARREIEKLAVASSDASQWQISQTEVEYLALLNALRAAGAGDATPREVRRRFDVFYSRIQTNKAATAFQDLRDMPRVVEALDNIQHVLDDAIPVIDSSDESLTAALPDLTKNVAAMQGELRAISLAGVQLFAERSKNLRLEVSDALTDLGWIALGLLVLLLGTVGFLLASMRGTQRQASKIAQTQDRLQAIISTSIDAVVVVDKSGVVLDFNGAAECIFGHSRSEALGADLTNLIMPDQIHSENEAGIGWYRNLVGDGLVRLEATKKDGSKFPVEMSVNSALSEEGEIFVAYIRDISKRVANEEELVEARDKALAGEKAKADLLAVMSHEMRTPLNGVLGTIQLLSDTKLEEAQRRYVGVMEASGQLLLEHVNNVLDISRLDAGAIEAQRQVFDVCALVESVVEGLRGQSLERGNQLTVETIGNPVFSVVGDEARVRQILFNLVGNAIKFTENGTVTVEIEHQPKEDRVEFRVIDNGIGIDERDLERIFSDFVTLDTSYNREVEGTGLGLGIAKRLVSLLGGEITVESVMNEGTAFSVVLPLSKAPGHEAEKTVPVASHTFATPKVLLVEDNEINRMVARDMLTKLGCDVTEAADGHEGVLLAENLQFDLIIMDISMPKVDGVTATRTIKSANGPNGETPIVALTAHALPEDVSRFRDAGMVDVITKPVSLDVLVETLGETLPAQLKSEMDDLLGPERASHLKSKAFGQLEDGFIHLEKLISDQSDREDITSLAHQLVGTAGLFELDEVLSELQKIEHAPSTATVAELKGYVAAARRVLM